jgi:hypothetical protein
LELWLASVSAEWESVLECAGSALGSVCGLASKLVLVLRSAPASEMAWRLELEPAESGSESKVGLPWVLDLAELGLVSEMASTWASESVSPVVASVLEMKWEPDR